MTGRRTSFGDTPERDLRTNGQAHAGHVTAELIAAYADQELERNSALEVERHVSECPTCEASLRLQRAVGDRLREEAATEVPAALRDRVFAAVRAAPVSVRYGKRNRLIAAFTRPAWAAAVLATLVIGVSWARSRIARATSVAAGVAAQPDSLAIVHLIQSHAAAWNTRSPDAVATLLTADAVWVTSSGVELRGRQAIRDAHAQWLEQDAALGATTHVHPDRGIAVRFVNEDVAVVDLVGQFIRSAVTGDQPAVVEQARIFVVATRDGDAWRISHLRNVNRTGTRPTPR